MTAIDSNRVKMVAQIRRRGADFRTDESTLIFPSRLYVFVGGGTEAVVVWVGDDRIAVVRYYGEWWCDSFDCDLDELHTRL